MTRPRQVLPGQFLLISRRCTQRQFLLRPDDETNNNVLYCIGCAMHKYQMQVLMLTVESNHEHLVIYDRHGNYPAFTEYLHKLIARSQNALRGRWENFWSAEEMCAVRLINREDVIARMIYTAGNPVKDRLVDRVHKWPGVNGYVNLLTGRAFTAKRPRHFFRPNGPMPASVTFHMTVPPELGCTTDVIAEVRAGVEALEQQLAQEIRSGGARVLGRRRILAQSWKESPTTVAPKRNLRPRFAAANMADRITALLDHRAFLAAYREARRRWVAQLPAVFPVGTYWLRRVAAVPIAAAVLIPA
jgi:putative transposase